MPENKPKATLIKQTRPSEMNIQGLNQSTEKKKVVILKKKPVVVAKSSGSDDAKAPAMSETQEETLAKQRSEVVKQKEQIGQPKESGEEKKKQPLAAPVQPVQSAQPVQAKKVVKKVSSAANTVINNGPVIISGANLPPIFPKTDVKTGVSRPVGSVGGINYGRDGRVLKPRYPKAQGQEKKPITGTYTPRGNNKGGFNKDFKKDGNAGGFKPGFNKGPSKSFGSDPLLEGKNKRVFSKDKGRDRRHEQVDEEFELKQVERKKSSEPQAVVAKNIDIMASVTVSDLAKKMNIKASEIISKLFSMGMMVSINQSIDSDTATIIAQDWYEYVEYGTTNFETIFLQRSGYSREASTYIKKHREYISVKEGIIKLKRTLLECPDDNVKTESQDVIYNMPDLFEDESFAEGDI